jgi:cell wall-associated NlpC family hydrolase
MCKFGETVASTNNGISGVAVSVVAVGALFIWAGVQNQTIINTLRDIAHGRTPTPGEQKKTEFSNSGGGYIAPSTGSGGNQRVVEIAAQYKGRPYVFGGGHGTVCPKGGMDCSGYVSCVLNRAGLMTGTLTTDGFSRWGISVPFKDRKPGDIIVWTGGPGGGHMGIIIDDDTMWHSPCTGCGGVQKASYKSSRTGRVSNVRRARNG